VVSATDSGTLTNSGTITIDDLATLTVGSSIVNVGAINLQITAGATLAIEAASGTNVSLTGAGKVTLSSTSDKISIGSGVTLTNVNNTIAGVGTIGTPGGPGALVNSGTIDAHGFLDTLFIDVRVINKGVMEATGPVTLAVNSGGTNFNVVEASGGHVEITAPFANSKTIEALSGEIIISGGTVANSSTGFVLVSGSVATLFIESGTIAGGKLQSLAGGKIIAENGNNVLSGVTIASGTLVQDKRPRQDHRSRRGQRRQRRQRWRAGCRRAQRYRSAEHCLRRADDARLCGERRPRRRHSHSDGRASRRGNCASRQLHGRELLHNRRRPWRHAGHRDATATADASDASASLTIVSYWQIVLQNSG